MLQRTRTKIVPAAVSVALCIGCNSKFDCDDEAVCDLVEQANPFDPHFIQGRQSTSWKVQGIRYHLVHFEYGVGRDCPSGCFYSHYCAVVVNDTEHPAWFSFNSVDEHLFDPLVYCPDLAFDEWYTGDFVTSGFECFMPAYDLPLFEDERFIDWVRDPENINDEFRHCRNQFSLGYHLGELPRE